MLVDEQELDDVETGFRDVGPRELITRLRYSLGRMEGLTDVELEVVADDLRDGAVSVIPAALLLERGHPTTQ